MCIFLKPEKNNQPPMDYTVCLLSEQAVLINKPNQAGFGLKPDKITYF